MTNADGAAWTARRRVKAVLAGQRPDRVPVSVWLHNFAREQRPEDLIAETLRLQEKFDFDFLKPQSPAHSAPLLWGAEISRPARADEWPVLTRPAVRTASDLEGITRRPVGGMLADQIAVMRGVRAALGPDVPIVATIFAPMMTLSLMHAEGKAGALKLMRSHPQSLHKALGAISETLTDFVEQVMEVGVDGLFYASNTCNRGEIDRQEHYDFHAPFDAQILEACSGGWMNILHICGPAVQTEFFLDYAPQIFSWAQTPANPTAAEMHEMTGKVVLTGAPGKPEFAETPTAELGRQVRSVLAEMDGLHQLVGPGCSINPGVDEALIAAVVDATRFQPELAA